MPGENGDTGVGTPKDDSTEGHIEPTKAQAADAEARRVALEAIKGEGEPSGEGTGGGDPPPADDKGTDEGTPKVDQDPAYQKLAASYGKLEKELRAFKKDQLPALQAATAERDEIIAALSDPAKRYELIEKHGGNYKEWTDRIVEDPEGSKTPEQRQIEQLASQVGDLTKIITEGKEAEKTAKEQAEVEARVTLAKDIVHNDSENRFPVMKALGLHHQMISVGKAMIDETGESPTDDQVAIETEKRVTARLGGQLKSLAEAPFFIEMMKEHGFTRGEAPARQDSDEGDGGGNGSRTLTNDQSASPSGPIDYEALRKDPKALREHAIREAAKAVPEEV